jgi:hypothetical protein
LLQLSNGDVFCNQQFDNCNNTHGSTQTKTEISFGEGGLETLYVTYSGQLKRKENQKQAGITELI